VKEQERYQEPITFGMVVIGLTMLAMRGAAYALISPLLLAGWIKSKVRPEPIYPKRGTVRPIGRYSPPLEGKKPIV
jgi:hypothetical protein